MKKPTIRNEPFQRTAYLVRAQIDYWVWIRIWNGINPELTWGAVVLEPEGNCPSLNVRRAVREALRGEK